LWPLTRLHPPTPGLYLSTDFEPSIVFGAIALTVYVITRLQTDRASS
ncbi:metal-dependent hydrolase, partial [Haloferax sp. Atlit-4N]